MDIINIISIIVTLISIIVAIYWGLASKRSNEKLQKEIDKSNSLQQELSTIQSELKSTQEAGNTLKQKEIDGFALAERNKVAPRLRPNGGMVNTNDQAISIYFENDGETAIIDEVEILSKEYKQHSKFLPLSIAKGDMPQLYFQIVGEESVTVTLIRLNILYRDIYNNNYTIELIGRNGNYKLGSPKYIPSESKISL